MHMHAWARVLCMSMRSCDEPVARRTAHAHEHAHVTMWHIVLEHVPALNSNPNRSPLTLTQPDSNSNLSRSALVLEEERHLLTYARKHTLVLEEERHLLTYLLTCLLTYSLNHALVLERALTYLLTYLLTCLKTKSDALTMHMCMCDLLPEVAE